MVTKLRCLFRPYLNLNLSAGASMASKRKEVRKPKDVANFYSICTIRSKRIPLVKRNVERLRCLCRAPNKTTGQTETELETFPLFVFLAEVLWRAFARSHLRGVCGLTGQSNV